MESFELVKCKFCTKPSIYNLLKQYKECQNKMRVAEEEKNLIFYWPSILFDNVICHGKELWLAGELEDDM